MSRPALIPQAEINRAVKAAAKVGYQVVIEGGLIRLLPMDGNAPLPSAEQAEDAWDKALGTR